MRFEVGRTRALDWEGGISLLLSSILLQHHVILLRLDIFFEAVQDDADVAGQIVVTLLHLR